MTAITKANRPVIVLVLVIVALLAIALFVFGRSTVDKIPKPLKLPDGGKGIPDGWSPVPSAQALHGAMSGAGTDEALIWSTLSGLTNDQLTAILNEFNNQFGAEYPGCDLYCWFRGDLSGEDLQRAMNYFNQSRA